MPGGSRLGVNNSNVLQVGRGLGVSPPLPAPLGLAQILAHDGCMHRVLPTPEGPHTLG